MFRFLIGYLSGTVMGILLIASLIARDQCDQFALAPIVFLALWFIILILGLVWSHKHHIKKRDEYYKKIRGPSKWLL